MIYSVYYCPPFREGEAVFKNMLLQGSWSLKLCISRPYFNSLSSYLSDVDARVMADSGERDRRVFDGSFACQVNVWWWVIIFYGTKGTIKSWKFRKAH